MLIAQVNDPIGVVQNPGPLGNDPVKDVGTLIGGAIALVFVAAGLAMLVYMLWGAIAWITSGGEKEKLMKAQARIRNAVLGIFMLIICLAVFVTIFQVVLGGKIIGFQNGQIQFNLPHFERCTGPTC